MVPEAVWKLWRKHFSGEPECLASAPGRVNLIGEHTDYNEGFVFPAAIDRRTYALLRKSPGANNLVSAQAGRGEPFEVSGQMPRNWAKYAAGCAKALAEEVSGTVPAIEGVIHSEIPNGSGLSSSAALELSLLTGWNLLGDFSLENKQLAVIAWRGDNEYVGVKCGVMDQMASAVGEEGKAIFLDTRSLETSLWPIPDALSLAVLDTRKPRALAASAYNQRVEECRQAAAALGVKALRDATLEDLNAAKAGMDETAFRRARHVITENARVLDFQRALASNDRAALRDLCRASHESLRDDYEVSCPELDAMVRSASGAPGCVGVRLTGAGFGGCCVALVEKALYRDFEKATAASYGIYNFATPNLFETRASGGASAVRLA